VTVLPSPITCENGAGRVLNTLIQGDQRFELTDCPVALRMNNEKEYPS
jgi:hypothetical protein